MSIQGYHSLCDLIGSLPLSSTPFESYRSSIAFDAKLLRLSSRARINHIESTYSPTRKAVQSAFFGEKELRKLPNQLFANEP
jgi:hypothetical protein